MKNDKERKNGIKATFLSEVALSKFSGRCQFSLALNLLFIWPKSFLETTDINVILSKYSSQVPPIVI